MADQLQRYREMRDFSITPEPRGAEGARASRRQLRYLHPAARRDAPALRLPPRAGRRAEELGGAERTEPRPGRQAPRDADRGPPARLRRLRGRDPARSNTARARCCSGTRASGSPRTPIPRAALRKGRLHFRLEGEKLHGSWILTRTRGNEDKPAWLLIKRNDEDARAGYDVTAERPESVKGQPKPREVRQEVRAAAVHHAAARHARHRAAEERATGCTR